MLFVVFAPALLDGTSEDEESYSADKPDDGRKTKVIVLNEPEQAMPAEEPEEKAREPEEKKPVAVTPPPAPKPAPREQSSSRSKRPTGFAVQLGSFSSRENADSFAKTVGAAGYDIMMIQAASSGGLKYRVYAGPEKTRAEAEKLAARLQAEGQSVLVVDLDQGLMEYLIEYAPGAYRVAADIAHFIDLRDDAWRPGQIMKVFETRPYICNGGLDIDTLMGCWHGCLLINDRVGLLLALDWTPSSRRWAIARSIPYPLPKAPKSRRMSMTRCTASSERSATPAHSPTRPSPCWSFRPW